MATSTALVCVVLGVCVVTVAGMAIWARVEVAKIQARAAARNSPQRGPGR